MLDRLRIIVRIVLICATLAIPIALLSWFFVAEAERSATVAERELVGTEHVALVWPVFTGIVADHALSGGKPGEATVAARTRLANDGSAFDEAHGSTELTEALAGAVELGERRRQIAAALSLMAAVRDRSALALDPDPDSYFLMDAVITRLPALAAAASDLRALLAAAHKTQGYITTEQRFKMVTSLADIERNLGDLATDLAGAASDNPTGTVAPATSGALARLDEATKAYLELVRPRLQVLMQGKFPKDIFVGVEDGEKSVQAAADGMWHAGLPVLRGLLEARLDRINGALLVSFAIVVVSLAAAAALVFMVARSVKRQLGRMAGVLADLEAGRAVAEVPYAKHRTEIGVIAASIAVLRDGLQGAAALRAERERALAEGARTAERRERLIDDFVRRMGAIAAGVAQSSRSVDGSAHTLTATADATADRAGSVQLSADDAAANVDTIAAATEELAASIGEIGAQVKRSTEVAAAAARDAHASEANIATLSRAASEIGAVIDLIRAVADQTNLLALNATIEAARAGEAGKGFAVVASEVKALAAQTARATNEIASRIAEIQAATGQSVEAMERIVGTIGSIETITGAIAASVQQQGAATEAIAENCLRAASGARSVSQTIADVRGAASDTGHSAKALSDLSGDLAGNARALEDEVEAFVKAVAAA